MRLPLFAALLLTVFMPACSPAVPEGAPVITIYKTPTCKCCSRWLRHLQEQGFATKVESVTDLAPVRVRLGVPDKLAACHTGVVNGYVVEGHVPAADIHRLLSEKPAGKGLAVPGMPIGSPGMEQGDQRDPYVTLLFQPNGQTAVFAQHGDPVK